LVSKILTPQTERNSLSDGEFKTANEATRYFAWNIRKNAARTIVQGNKVNLDGKIVGQRAVFLLKTHEKTKPWVVMWTEEAYFYAVYAPTLSCAEEVERQSRH
jgi:hypothetical protein